MRAKHPQRLVGSIIVGLVLAITLWLQAMSGAVARRAPELALAVMPGNGEALDRLAFAEFAQAAADPSDTAAVVRSAQNSLSLARDALQAEPLLSRSLTLVGLAQEDLEQQGEFLELADAINRRDVSLQGVRLGNKVAAEDYDGVFETVPEDKA